MIQLEVAFDAMREASPTMTIERARAFIGIAKSGEVGVGVRQLKDICDKNDQQMNRILNGLEEAGLILRGPDPEDRRAAIVRLTDRGRELSRKIAEAIDGGSQ